MLYSRKGDKLKYLIAHPGGPLFRKKDEGHWSIPKGEPDEGETDLLAVAKREFGEETGLAPPDGADYLDLGCIQQKGGKWVYAWAFPGEWDDNRQLISNHFEMEWPPHSGKTQSFPEVDRVELCSLKKASKKLKAAQVPLLERLEAMLSKS